MLNVKLSSFVFNAYLSGWVKEAEEFFLVALQSFCVDANV